MALLVVASLKKLLKNLPPPAFAGGFFVTNHKFCTKKFVMLLTLANRPRADSFFRWLVSQTSFFGIKSKFQEIWEIYIC